MKAKFSITYQTVTPESAEQGDYSQHGWIMPGYWQYPLADDDGQHDDVLEQAKSGEFDLSLSEAVSFAQSLGIYDNSGSSWFQSVDPDQDYQTGEDTFYSLHVEGVTPSTYNRIAKLLQD